MEMLEEIGEQIANQGLVFFDSMLADSFGMRTDAEALTRYFVTEPVGERLVQFVKVCREGDIRK